MIEKEDRVQKIRFNSIKNHYKIQTQNGILTIGSVKPSNQSQKSDQIG
jgi:hypothetical protein